MPITLRSVNALAADGVTKAIMDDGHADAYVTGVEEMCILHQHVDLDYLCLITFAVTGSLHAAIKIIEASATS